MKFLKLFLFAVFVFLWVNIQSVSANVDLIPTSVSLGGVKLIPTSNLIGGTVSWPVYILNSDQNYAKIIVNIKNQGSDPTLQGFKNDVWGNLVDQNTILAPGASAQYEVNSGIWAPGIYSIQVCVDYEKIMADGGAYSYGVIYESDETNNCKTWTFDIRDSDQSPPVIVSGSDLPGIYPNTKTVTLRAQKWPYLYDHYISEVGFCIGTSPNPTDCKSTTPIDDRFSDSRVLNSSTKYYSRAYLKRTPPTDVRLPTIIGYSGDRVFTMPAQSTNSDLIISDPIRVDDSGNPTSESIEKGGWARFKVIVTNQGTGSTLFPFQTYILYSNDDYMISNENIWKDKSWDMNDRFQKVALEAGASKEMIIPVSRFDYCGHIYFKACTDFNGTKSQGNISTTHSDAFGSTNYIVETNEENNCSPKSWAENSFDVLCTPTATLTVVTGPVTAFAQTTATSSVETGGGVNAVDAGIVWSTTQNPTVESASSLTINTEGNASGFKSLDMTGLTPDTTYYVKAYGRTQAVHDAGGIYTYGNQVTFKTSATTPLTVVTGPVTAFAQTTATSSVTTGGGVNAVDAGIVWSTTETPRVGTNQSGINTSGYQSGFKSLDMTGLTPDTTYYVQAYGRTQAVHGVDGPYTYGDQMTFKTSATTTLTVVTGPITAFDQTTATSSVETGGGVNALQAGIVWGTTKDPKVFTNQGINTSGYQSGFKSLGMTGLTANTHYYVRAYGNISATETIDTSYTYGENVEFTTKAIGPTLTVVTGPVTAFAQTTATSSVETGGGVNALQAGIVWGTTLKPKVFTNHSGINTSGYQSGFKSIDMTGLNAGTLYHVRAYGNISATDTTDASYTYGDDVTFVTKAAPNTGIWKNGTCPQCDYSGGEIKPVCTGGNSYCTYPAPDPTICPATPACSCNNNNAIDNGETGIDCGGTSSCPACKNPPKIIEI